MSFDLQPLADALLGPVGLTAFLVIVVWAFVTERVVPAQRLRDATTATKEALGVAGAANDAFDRMAAALEQRNEIDAQRVSLTEQNLKAGGDRRRSRR